MKYISLIFLSLLTLFFVTLHAQDSVPTPADSQIIDSPAVEDPPEWLIDGLDKLYAIPVVGPVVSKVVQWVGVIGTILTLLAGFLLASIKALSGVLQFAKLSEWAVKISALQNSKVFYWIKYFSFLNAKRPDPKPDAKV